MREISRQLLVLLCCASPSLLSAADTIKVTVSPQNQAVGVGFTQQYTASVTGLTDTTVTWSVANAGTGNSTVGTITAAGLYKAPATLPGQNPVTIKATASNGMTVGSAYVLIELLGPTLTSVSPNPLHVGTYHITVNGTGFLNGALITVADIQLPTAFVSSTQLTGTGYQGPAQNVVVTVKNPGTLASNPLTVPFTSGTGDGGGAITVSPASASVTLGTTKQFTATGQSSVTWTASAGTISSTGLFTAPAVMPASSAVTIKAAGSNNQAGTATVTLVNSSSPPITVSPATVNVTLGTVQLFTATGQTSVTWTATAGTITAGGLFTAPSVMPASTAVTIKATGAGSQFGTATVTLVNIPPQPITVSPSTASVALSGTQLFTATGQTTVAWSASAGTISATGLYTAPAAMPASPTVVIKATGSGNQSGTATVTLTGVTNPLVSANAARRFLQQAAFGPTPADAAHVQTIGFHAWLTEQFAMGKISNYNGITSSQGGLPTRFLANAVTNPDQLRQRVAFALSQMTVIAINKLIWNQNIIPFEELLSTDAFTNYRQILGDVTLSPSMGGYLDMANNAKANPALGTVANENYARELMQLFSIGTNMLNPDGSLQLVNGNPVPTYNQTNVTELARVFTGWTYTPTSGAPYWGINIDGFTNMTVPMSPIAAYHDAGSKALLNGYVAAAGLTPQQDVQGALDNLFSHSNVGPFVSKQLIQHLVKSNPTPAYVSRVAAIFADNGFGARGDMQAVITAILLDPEARANDNGGNDLATDGHLQEPALYLVGLVRALNGQMNDQNYFASDLAVMGQDIYDPPSVFNYYSPGYTIPGVGLKGPEFQIYNTFTSIYRANLISNLFNNYSNPVQTYGPGTTVDLTPFVALAGTPSALVNALDTALTGGVMPAALKQIVVTAVQADAGTSPLHQVQTALYLILSSNYYNVWH